MGFSPPALWASFRKWLREPPRALKAALVGLVLYRFALALVFPVFSDPGTYFIYAKAFAADPGLYLERLWFPPPLVPLLGALLVPWAGEVGLKLIAPAFGTLALLYTYRLGRHCYSERVGLLGAVLLGILPAHLHYSALGYLDAPVTAFCIMTLYHSHRALEGGSRRDAWTAGAAAGLAALSKETGAVAAAFIFFYFAVRALRRRKIGAVSLRIALTALVAAGALASVYYVGHNYRLYGDLGITKSVGQEGLTNIGLPVPAPGEENAAFLASISEANRGGGLALLPALLKQNYLEAWGFPSGRADVIPLPGSLVLLYALSTLLFVPLVLLGFGRGLTHPSKLLWLWVVLWALAVVLVTAALGQFFLLYSFRRLLPLAPVLAIFAALGWTVVREKLSPRKGLAGAVLVLLVLAGSAAAASEAGKAAVAVSYHGARADALAYLKALPPEARIMAPDKDLVDYYSGRISLHLPWWKAEGLDAGALRRLGVTHAVTDDGYLWFDLSTYRRAFDDEVSRGVLRLAGIFGPVRIYEVPGAGVP
ncbi:MAG: glycosyltransferase family 39 protein [Halobacteria archaeon]